MKKKYGKSRKRKSNLMSEIYKSPFYNEKSSGLPWDEESHVMFLK